jgi:hypothetical protein
MRRIFISLTALSLIAFASLFLCYIFRYIRSEILPLAANLSLGNGIVHAASAGSQPGQNIWIYGSDGTLSPLHLPVNFHPTNNSNISISRSGLVLYIDEEARTHLINLHDASDRALPSLSTSDDAVVNGIAHTSEPARIVFSADGKSLFWFQNSAAELQHPDKCCTPYKPISQTGTFRAWTTDLNGLNKHTVAQIALPSCKCDTGACSDTCPQIQAWTPPSGITSFFYLTQFIQGQTEGTDLETDLYQLENGVWKSTKLASPNPTITDARDNGETFIAEDYNAGCCGSANSDDRTYVVRKGTKTTFFDEDARFHDQGYDIGFSTSDARFSPDGKEIAYTIKLSNTDSDAEPNQLSDEGKDNSEELRRINSVIAKLPQVEVIAFSDLSKPRFSLNNTQLISWLDEHRLLVWKAGKLFFVDATSGQLTATGLKVKKAEDVFLK